MADNRRAEFQAEITRLQQAIQQTRSKHLKNDYGKRIRRMKKDLAEYDRYQRESENAKPQRTPNFELLGGAE